VTQVDSPEVEVARYAARISWWALTVSAGSMAATAAMFALELRRWFDEGVNLSLSVMAEARTIGGARQDQNTHLVLSVANRGSAPTTITHMVLYDYPGWFSYLIGRKRPEVSVVLGPVPPDMIGHPPYVLQPGAVWMGMANHTPELKRKIDGGRLYVGVVGSHARKPILKRVTRWKPPEDAKPAS
jgi:hypothetical protein